MSVLEENKFILKKYGITANKRFGQNFLCDEESLELMAEGITKDDVIIEIGPGLGTLTKILLEKAKRVIAIEIDPNMVRILEDRFKMYDNFELINKDVLELNISELAENPKVIANLPYYITTPIITKLIKERIQTIRVLIQKEVADRITAKTGERLAGEITYYIDYYADSKYIGDVKKEYFIPMPKVESAIIELKLLDKKRFDVKNEEFMFKLIKDNFLKRRKTILNSLNIDKILLKDILKKLNISENTRGEKLTLREFALISNLCYNLE